MQNLAIQDLKLKEVIHYLSYLSGGNPRKLGKVRLNKILWFFEGIMYIKTGKKSINIKFIKKKYGPVSPNVDKALAELEDARKIKVDNEDGNWIIKAVDIPKINYLSTEEIELLSNLYNTISSFRAKTVSNITHTKYWETLDQGDEMNPIFVLETLAKIRKPKEDELEEIIRLHKLYKENKVVDEIKKQLV
jgi:uncharacterized phage-associated protein